MYYITLRLKEESGILIIRLRLSESRRFVSDVSSSEDGSQDEIFSKSSMTLIDSSLFRVACQSFTLVGSSRRIVSDAADRYMQIESLVPRGVSGYSRITISGQDPDYRVDLPDLLLSFRG